MSLRHLLTISILLVTATCAAAGPWLLKITDADSGRPVPLVELETVHHLKFVTDNSGVIAVDDPELLDQDVFFHIRSHGYEIPKDGFGYRGKRFHIQSGEAATLQIKRINLAERLYRITGAGTYAESVKAGVASAGEQCTLNAKVMGSDSAHASPFNGKLFWLWGDTHRIGYPLGNFQTTAATSSLEDNPETGIILSYFQDQNQFTKKMADFAGEGPTWLDALVTVKDEHGNEHLVASYTKIKPPLTPYERGLCEFDTSEEVFKKLKTIPLDDNRFPEGHPFRSGSRLYFGNGLPDLSMPDSYEAWLQPKLWDSVAAKKELADARSDARIVIHRGAVTWSPFRKRWTFVFTEKGGKASHLGEIWYAESRSLTGPWSKAVQIVTHDRYSFYNPLQHPEFSKGKGRYLYFEGTYTKEFSGNPVATPRYDYNQILYRLDLGDPRLDVIE